MRRPRALSRAWAHTLRVHVVGCSPRSGTTLMHMLLTRCYDLAGADEHERNLYKKSRVAGAYCTKLPRDLPLARLLLPSWPGLHVVYLRRDARDVVVSRHRQRPGVYWAPLRIWRQMERLARRLEGHPRFHAVRYEDLVTNPLAVQAELERRWPFLVRRHDFTDAALARGKPHPRTEEALGGVRPIQPASIGRWRAHLPRLKGQVLLHGSPTAELVRLGYAPDASWEALLDGVTPDLRPSHWPDRLSRWQSWQARMRPWWQAARFLAARPARPVSLAGLADRV